MKALQLKGKSDSNAYEVEKNLRIFADLTSQGISTLLSALMAEIEEALQSESPEAKDKALTLSLKALDHALFISKNLRYFSKKSQVPHKVSDISEQVLHTLDALEKDFKDQAIELGAFIESGIFSRLDPGALHQILSNLLLNAVSAMPTGGKLTVALARNKQQLEFCISDTGFGLRKDQIDHLFEPYQTISQKSFHAKDRGLGLIVAKALIESEGGELSVRSTVGKGTNFIFTLPYDPSTPKPEPFLQKRRFQRVDLTIPAEVSFPGAEKIQTRVTTISTGGCFLELPPNVLAPHKNVLVNITLFSLGDAPLYIADARVANVHSNGEGTGVGLEFNDVDKKTLSVLRSIVKGHAPG